MKDPYVHKLRHVNRARIYPCTKQQHQLKIEILDLLGPAEIDICTDRKPQQISGAELVGHSNGLLTLSVKQPGTTVIQF